MAILLGGLWIGRQITQDNRTHVYFLDVGQGDCAVVLNANGCLIIDGGGDADRPDQNNVGHQILLPFLLDKRVRQIDQVIISHLHYDHIKGILEIIGSVPIREIVLSATYQAKYQALIEGECLSVEQKPPARIEPLYRSIETIGSAYTTAPYQARFDGDLLLQQLITKAGNHRIKISFIQAGDQKIGSFYTYQCLYPMPDMDYVYNENNNSNVIQLQLDGVRFLFTGDVEIEAERQLCRTYGHRLQSDILKVAHHGSITSSSLAFLEFTQPKIGIISCGSSHFGHPHPEIVARYQALKIPIYITEECGMIDTVPNQQGFGISVFLNQCSFVSKGRKNNEATDRAVKEK